MVYNSVEVKEKARQKPLRKQDLIVGGFYTDDDGSIAIWTDQEFFVDLFDGSCMDWDEDDPGEDGTALIPDGSVIEIIADYDN